MCHTISITNSSKSDRKVYVIKIKGIYHRVLTISHFKSCILLLEQSIRKLKMLNNIGIHLSQQSYTKIWTQNNLDLQLITFLLMDLNFGFKTYRISTFRTSNYFCFRPAIFAQLDIFMIRSLVKSYKATCILINSPFSKMPV